MIRKFKTLTDDAPIGEKSAVRALQVWQILISKASNFSIIPYIDLAKRLGYADARPLTTILGHIMFYCQQNKLPPLTAIVVSKWEGVPGEGFIAITPEELDIKRMEVFHYKWFEILPPTIEELKQAYQSSIQKT